MEWIKGRWGEFDLDQACYDYEVWVYEQEDCLLWKRRMLLDDDCFIEWLEERQDDYKL